MVRFTALRIALLSLVALLWLPSGAAAFSEDDLLGTWFLLIHYRNSETANPDADRWEDKIWTFEKKGSRLLWTEYPIVVFSDQAGRFERTLGQRSRVLAAWQPNSGQQAQIDGGLEINSRGSKSKTLRGSLEKGYASAGRLRTGSASIIGYMENWSITGGPDKPVFARDDMMGSGRTESMEGRTEYATQEISDDGRLLRGLYERDGIRKGTFQLMRAGTVTRVAGKSEKVAEERRQLFVEGVQRSVLETNAASGDKESSDSEQQALRYLYSLPQKQREEVMAKLEGASPAEQARVMREHYASLPKAEQQQFLSKVADAQTQPASIPGAVPEPQRLNRGMTLKEGLEVLHGNPEEVTSPVLVRKLQVLRLGPDGEEEIAYKDIQSGDAVLSADDSYGVLAILSCSSPASRVDQTVWQVYANGALAGWETTHFKEDCVMARSVVPATLVHGTLENRVTERIGRQFPDSSILKIQVYRRALATLREGRLADAEALLAKADQAIDTQATGIAGSDRGRGRGNITTTSDRDALRKQLVEAIARAKAGSESSVDLAPDELSPAARERMVANYMESLSAQEQAKLFRDIQGRSRAEQARIVQTRIEALPAPERERLYREALAGEASPSD